MDSFEICTSKESTAQRQVGNDVSHLGKTSESDRNKFAQIISTGNFSAYENPKIGFNMLYPSNWIIKKTKKNVKFILIHL